jgi:chromosome partitioning protein
VPSVAVYNLKGGVGKTTVSVNFAWAAASLGGRNTLLWDLDGQGASTWILSPPAQAASAFANAKGVLDGGVAPQQLIVPTDIAGLSLLPADISLHDMDEGYARNARTERIKRVMTALDRQYDLIVLDCSPGLGATNTELIALASLVLMPVLPSALSSRALREVQMHLARARKPETPIFPVFNMVDMRRTVHRQAIEAGEGYPVIPAASAIELMGERRMPVAVFAPRSKATQAFTSLWHAMEPHLS